MYVDLKQRLGEGALLWIQLVILAVAHVPAVRGLELPFIERTGIWHLRESPGVSAALAAFSAAVLVALWFIRPERRVPRLAIAGVLLVAGLVGGVLFASVLIFTFGGTAMTIARPHLGPRARTELPPPGPHNPRISVLTLVIPILLALGATLVHSKVRSGEFIPPEAPEDQLMRARHFLSAAPVATAPIGGAPRALVLHPELTREQMLRHYRDERGAWSAVRVLHRLDDRGVLASLPTTDAARVQALFAPALGSGVLVTPEGAPLMDRPLWGVVVEAEGRRKERLVLLSLGAGEPMRASAPTYHLIFEVPAVGGLPRLLHAEHVFPSRSGFVGIALPGIFLIYLVAFLFASAGLAVWRHSRATTGSATD